MKLSLNTLKDTLKSIGEPIDKQMLADLKRGIEIEFGGDDRTPSTYYAPSGLGCVRNMYYKRLGMEVEEDRKKYSMIGILESGTDRHTRIQEYFIASKRFKYLDVEAFIIKQGLGGKLEVKMKKGAETMVLDKVNNIQFLADGLIQYEDKVYVLEIKTETQFKFNGRNSIAPEHLSQGIAYSISFELEDVVFLYENRDTCEKKVFHLKVTEEMKNKYVLDKIKIVEKAIKKGKAPEIAGDFLEGKANACRYCKYKKICRMENKAT